MALAPYPWLEEPAQTLLAMRDRMPNAVLLYGAPGAGLYELALAFSKSLFCLSPHSDGTPCGHCTGCRLAQAGTHPDFKQVLSEAQCARYDVAYEPAETNAAMPRRSSPAKSAFIKFVCWAIFVAERQSGRPSCGARASGR